MRIMAASPACCLQLPSYSVGMKLKLDIVYVRAHAHHIRAYAYADMHTYVRIAKFVYMCMRPGMRMPVRILSMYLEQRR